MQKRSNPYGALKRIILACMILVPFVPFMAVLVIGYSYFKASLENSAISSLQRIVEDHRQMIDAFLSERLSDLVYIQRSHSFQTLARPSALADVFGHLGQGSPAFIDLGIFDERGLHVAYQGPYELSGRFYHDTEWFREVLKKGVYISDIFMGYRQVPHFIVAVAGSEEGDRWVIRATIDSQFFNDLVKNVHIGKTGEAYLLNSAGVYQTEPHSGTRLMAADPDAGRATASPDGGYSYFVRDASGTPYLYATTWLNNKDWRLVVRQQRDDAFSALRSAAVLVIFTSLVGGVVIAATAFYLTNVIVRRIERADAEKNQLAEQLIRAGRLAEIGEMATGFAHEINNPLQIIKSEQALVEMIMDDLKQRGELQPTEDLGEMEGSLAQIKQQVERCAVITQSILKFGRKSESVTASVDLRAFIPEVIAMVAKKASVHGIAITSEVAEGIPAISGDPGQLQQVLLNLFNNAMDAIIECRGSSGGSVAVSAGIDRDGDVEICVRDNGCGIPAEDIEKIFTPFFTTKPVGRGTGLGLSVCYGIIVKMGGRMAVESEPGRGTTIIIRLPVERPPDETGHK